MGTEMAATASVGTGKTDGCNRYQEERWLQPYLSFGRIRYWEGRWRLLSRVKKASAGTSVRAKTKYNVIYVGNYVVLDAVIYVVIYVRAKTKYTSGYIVIYVKIYVVIYAKI